MKELIFTSASKGLSPGSRGYTTVAASPNMSPPLIARLEKLSAYPFAFELGDERSNLNPVGYSHQRLTLVGRSFNVLSRRATAGVDYTGRSNLLAHHLLIESSERSQAGPAWLATQPGLFTEVWSQNDTPHYIEPARTAPAYDASPTTCSAWAHATGDAGWGAALVRLAHESPGRIAYLIYPPGVDIMPLICESMALLPTQMRWRIGFNTYFNADSRDVTCLWRGILAGTTSEKTARQDSRALIVDLTVSLTSPPDDEYTRAAQEGLIYEPPKAKPVTVAKKVSVPLSSTDSSREADLLVEQVDEGKYDLDIVSQPPQLPRGALQMTSEHKPRRRWVMPAVAAVVLLLIGSAFLAAWLLANGKPDNGLATDASHKVDTDTLSPQVDSNSGQDAKDAPVTDKEQPDASATLSPDTIDSDTNSVKELTAEASSVLKEGLQNSGNDQVSTLAMSDSPKTMEDSDVSNAVMVTIRAKGARDIFGNEYMPIGLPNDMTIYRDVSSLIFDSKESVPPKGCIINLDDNEITLKSNNPMERLPKPGSLSFSRLGGMLNAKWSPPETKSNDIHGLRLVVADSNDTDHPMVFYLSNDYKQVAVDISKPVEELSGHHVPIEDMKFEGDNLFLTQTEGEDVSLHIGKDELITIIKFDNNHGSLILDPTQSTVTITSPYIKDWKDWNINLNDWNQLRSEAKNTAVESVQEEAIGILKEYNRLESNYDSFKQSVNGTVTIYEEDKFKVPVKRLTITIEVMPMPELSKLSKHVPRYAEEAKKRKSQKKDSESNG